MNYRQEPVRGWRWRQDKREARKTFGSAVEEAYYEGLTEHHSTRRAPRNPYPPGLRRVAWEEGRKEARG